MDAKLTDGPWVLVIGKPIEIFDGTHHCSIGLAPAADGSPFADGMRTGCPDYMMVSGICRPADAIAMAAAVEMLAALKAWEKAFDVLFQTCLSNGVFNAWGQPVDCTSINEANQISRAAITKATTIPAVSSPIETPDGAA